MIYGTRVILTDGRIGRIVGQCPKSGKLMVRVGPYSIVRRDERLLTLADTI